MDFPLTIPNQPRRSRALRWLGVIVLLGLSVGTGMAQAIKNRDVEGVLFYKEHSFTDSAEGAWPIEYRSAASNEQIILITTREGRRVRALIGQVPDMIPYPGRGGVTKKEALVLCDIAILRYPQHRQLLSNIRRAWAEAGSDDFRQFAPISEMRQAAMDAVIDNMVAESERIRAQLAASPSVPFSSLLDKSPPPTSSSAAVPASGEPSDAGAGGDPEQTLKSLEDYYRLLQQMH